VCSTAFGLGDSVIYDGTVVGLHLCQKIYATVYIRPWLYGTVFCEGDFSGSRLKG